MTLPRGVAPTLLLSAVVVLVAVGLADGLWLANLHNALLAVSFAGVGAYVLVQRPGHREGVLFVATGVVEAIVFCGRQVAHAPAPGVSQWWAWVGVWPLALALALTTVTVVLFPDGRLPSPVWRPVLVVVVSVLAGCAALSALWPVEYAAAGVTVPHPLDLPGHRAADAAWSRLAHPAYAAGQLLWVVAIVQRWRVSRGQVRRQLVVVLAAASITGLALVVGLVGWGSPRAGLLTVALVPVAAGWAIVHGQHAAAYSALSWLSRPGGPEALPTGVARALSDALSAPAVLWMGDEQRLLAVGVWPESGVEPGPWALADLVGDPAWHTRPVERGGELRGAVGVRRPEPLSLAEARLLGDLAAQAGLVLEHVSLADEVARQARAGHLDGLSPRERDVLQLMARGLSNAAICAELHLSVKTVEPVVGAIFAKLGLHADSASNRRVLAVLAYLRS